MLKVVIPEVQTETIKGIQYRVLETNNILCEFYDLDTAKKYVEKYNEYNLKLKYVCSTENNRGEILYDTNHDQSKWLKIEKVKNK